jgi:hypothetical protein
VLAGRDHPLQVFTIAGTSAVSTPQVPDIQTGNFPLNGVLNTPSVDLPAARNVVAATTEGLSPVSIENNFNSIFEGQQSRRPETSVTGFVNSLPSLAVVEPNQASQMMVGRVAPSQMQAHIGGVMPNFHLATPMVAYSSSYSNPMTAPPRKALQTVRQSEEAPRRPKEAYESYVPKQSPMPEYATLVKRRDAGEAAKGIVWQEKWIEG